MSSSLYFYDDYAWEQRAITQVATRRQRWDQMFTQVTPRLHADVANLARTYPTLPSGLIESAAVAGVDPTSEGLANLAEDFTADQEGGWNFLKTITKPFEYAGGLAKAQVRNAATAWDLLWEEIIARPLRTAVGVYQGMSLPEAYTFAGESTGVRAIRQFMRDPAANAFDWLLPNVAPAAEDRVNLGSGFFADSDQIYLGAGDDPTRDPAVQELLSQGVPVEEAVRQANAAYGRPITDEFKRESEQIQISRGGKSVPVSPGRLAAITVSEPDTALFNISSGIADAAAQIYLDPAEKILKGYKLARLARNTLLPDGVRKATTLRGQVFGKLSPSLDEFIDSSLGNDLARWTADNTNFSQIRSVYGRKVQGSQHIKWLKALTDETDPNKVKSLIRAAYDNPASSLYASAAPVNLGLLRRNRRGLFSSVTGSALGGELGRLGGGRVAMKHRLEGGVVYRLFSEMGGKAIPVGDLAAAIDELESFMSSAGFGADEMSNYLYRLADANPDNYEDILSVTRDVVNAFGARLAAEGVPAPAVAYFTDIFKTQESLRQYFINQAGEPAFFPGARWKLSDGGETKYLPTAHLMTEFINRAVPLPNPREVRKAVNRAGARSAFGVAFRVEDQADLAEGAITRLMDGYMSRIWKPLTLIRVAWPVRVIGEEQLRMVGADLDSVFRHPIQYMGWALHSKGRLGKHVANVLRGERGILGSELDESLEYQKAMSTYRSFGLDHRLAPGPSDFVKVRRGEELYMPGLVTEYTQLAADPIAREVAAAGARAIRDGVDLGNTSYFDVIKQRFWDGDLAGYRKRFINDSGHFELLQNRRWADGYVDSVWARITDKTGGGYHYFDTDGRWYDGLTHNPLSPAEIPGGGAATSWKANTERFMEHIDDSLADLDATGAPPRADDLAAIREVIDATVANLSSRGYTDEATILSRIGGVVDGAVDEAYFLETGHDVNINVDEAVAYVGQALTDVGRFWDENQDLIRAVSDVSETGGVARQRILGNELEDFAAAAATPSGGAQFGGQPVRPFAAAIETMEPMRKFTPLRGDAPNGLSYINGADPARPAGIAFAHNGTILGQVGLDWRDGKVVGIHINTADLTGMDDIPFPSSREMLNAFSDALESLGPEMLPPENLMNMILSGVPIRDWLMSSPALRNLTWEDASRLSVKDLLSRIASSYQAPGFTLADVADSLTDARRANLIGPASSHLSLGADDERIGVMFAQAFRFEYGDEWTSFIKDIRGRIPRRGTTAPASTYSWLREGTDEDLWGPWFERLGDATGQDVANTREWFFQAVEAELRANWDLTDEASAGAAAAREAMQRSALPLLSPPGGYPITYQGGRSLAALVQRQFRPERLREVPLDRTMYHIHTSGNIDLIEAIANGRLGDIDLAKITSRKQAQTIGRTLNADYASYLPEYVKAAKVPDAEKLNMWDQAISTMFSEFMSKPTNKLSRSPAFRQFYWKRVARMLPYMDESTQAAMIARAEEAGVQESLLRNELRNWLRSLRGKDDVSRGAVELERLAQYPVTAVAGKTNLAGTFEGKPATLGRDALEDIDMVAKAYALEETQRLLYDITRKHDFADMTRNIFPFAEAWSEILTSWLRIFAENPRMLRRLQQVVEGVRGAGWLYQDPATGEEVFNYPGSGLIARWMLGDNAALQLAGGALAGAAAGAASGIGGPVAGAVGGGLLGAGAAVGIAGTQNENELGDVNLSFTGRAQGLNLLAGNYLPGFGPIVQIPMANLMSNQLADPDWRWVRDLVLPFGGQEVDSPGEAIIDTALPAWFRKGLVSLAKGDGDNQRLYANTVIDVYKALLSGTGSDATPEEAAITLSRAKEIARNIYRIRAIAQFAYPTGPQVRFDIRDQNGQNWTFINLAQEWARMERNNNYDDVATFDQFTERFGLDPTLFATAKTTSVVPRTTTEAGLDWENKHPELFDPSSPYYYTAYFARPDDPFAEFSYPAYLRQLEEATRQSLTPEQWVSESNDFLGRVAYERARRQVLGRTDDAARSWLRQYRYQLMDVYPGYNSPTVGIGKRVEREQMLRSFQAWEENDTLANTEAGQGLLRYLTARDAALAQAQSLGITESGFATAKSTAHLRRWLEQIGQYYATIYPDFGAIYDRVMRHELEDEEAQIAALQLGTP